MDPMIKGVLLSGPAVILDYEVPLYKLSKLYPFFTGTPPYYKDEDYPAGPEINEPIPE